jgi:beta-mannosidase
LTITASADGETLTLSCKRPIKGIILDVADRSTDEEAGECKWSDQAIDLMPGDTQVVVARGLKGRKVKARVSRMRISAEAAQLTVFPCSVPRRRICLR